MSTVSSSQRFVRDEEKTPLLSDGQQDAPALPSADARSITIGFYLMAVCFSVNHGTVTGGSTRLQALSHLTQPRLLTHAHFQCVATESCVSSALLSLASVNLGLDLGGYSSGALYAAYTISAATVAAYGGCHVFLVFTLNP